MPALWTRSAVEMCTVQAAECTQYTYVRQMGMISSAMHLHWMSSEAFKDEVVGHKRIRTYVRRHLCTQALMYIRIYAQQSMYATANSTFQKQDTTSTVLQERVTQKVQ